MRKTESRQFEIEDAEGQPMSFTVKVTQLPGTRSTKLANKLSRTVLPAVIRMGSALKGMDTSRGLANAKVDFGGMVGGLVDGVDALFAAMPEEDFEKLWKSMFEFAEVTVGEKTTPLTTAIIDELFAGEALAFYQVVAFALEVNFQDFFRRLAALPPAMKTGMASVFNSVVQGKTSSPSGASSQLRRLHRCRSSIPIGP